MKRKIEIFTAGCPVCEEQVRHVKETACESCEIEVLNLNSEPEAFTKAKEYGIRSIPAVVIDGKLAECCENSGINMEKLREMGLGLELI